MSFRTDKIRGKHPITPKKGIKETDLSIKEKGSNDTIKVSIKPRKKNIKEVETQSRYLQLKTDISDIDGGDFIKSYEKLTEKYMKDIEEHYGDKFGETESQYSKPSEVRAYQIGDYLERFHDDELNGIRAKYVGYVDARVGNVGYANLDITDPRIEDLIPEKFKQEQRKRLYDSLGAEQRDNLFRNLYPKKENPEALSDFDWDKMDDKTRKDVAKGMQYRLHRRFNWNTISDEMRKQVVSRYGMNEQDIEKLSKKELKDFTPKELYEINDILAVNPTFQSGTKLRPISRKN